MSIERNGALRPRIVSIGNIEVGGGGKTPCTIAIAESIVRRGGKPVVLMRGYCSHVADRRLAPYVVTAGYPIIDAEGLAYYSDGKIPRRAGDAKGHLRHTDPVYLIGDEAALYERRGIPVVIDADRVRGAHVAGRLFSPSHILLDDAFQNHSLRKDLDIVLLDSARPFGCGALLPYGTLRERPDAVRRADIVVFTRAAGRELPREAADLVRGKDHFFARHTPEHLVSRDGTPRALPYLAGKQVALFSGIARPDSFEVLVRGLGVHADVSFRFIDHHRYRSRDVSWMLRETSAGIVFLTTEKDWVKAAKLFPPEIEMYALQVRLEITDLERLIDAVMR